VRAVQRAAVHPWRDARFWRQAAATVAETRPADVSGRDLAQTCLAFKRIEFASPILAKYCEKYMDERRQALNTFEIAAVLAYFVAASTGKPDAQDFVRALADEACIEWRLKETVPWVAWRMLVTASANAGVAHQLLFTTASPHLCKSVQFMTGRDAVDVCDAYATLGFKHHALLDEIAKFLPSMGLSDSEVRMLQQFFDRLDVDAPLLHRIRELHSYDKIGTRWR